MVECCMFSNNNKNRLKMVILVFIRISVIHQIHHTGDLSYTPNNPININCVCVCVLHFLKCSDNFQISISYSEEPGFPPSPLPSTAVTICHAFTPERKIAGENIFFNNIICHRKTDEIAKNYLILWKEQWKSRKINWPKAFLAQEEFDHLNLDVPNRKEKIISNSRSQIQNLIEDSPYVNLGPISYAYRIRVTWK